MSNLLKWPVRNSRRNLGTMLNFWIFMTTPCLEPDWFHIILLPDAKSMLHLHCWIPSIEKSNDSSYSRILANPAPKNQPFFPRKKLVVNPCESESIYSLRSHRFVAPRVVSQSAISLQIKVTTRIITPNLPNIHLCLQVLKWCMQIFRESHNKGIFHAYWGLHFWELYSIN